MSSGVVVPTTAVALRGTQYWAFVQVQPGVFESRDVTLGYEGPNEVIVSHGLEVGEQVVSDNMLILARAFRIAQDAAPAASAPMSTSSAASIAVNPEKSQGNKK
jgi:cobalt-zinc-cadmium efflux system membrane fusion protein